jgi:hypothetical protein
MYRHSHSVLALAALTGGALHPDGVNVIFGTVLAATVAGGAVSVSHIAFGLGLRRPRRFIDALNRG